MTWIEPLTVDEETTAAASASAGDRGAWARLVEAHLPMLKHIARRHQDAARRRGLDRDDLAQEGAFGLMRAAERFDPDRGIRFGSYAWPAIERRMIDAIASSPRPAARLAAEPAGAHGVSSEVGPDLRATARAVVARLGARERRVIELRYGLAGPGPLSRRAIGDLLGLGPTRIAAIEGQAVDRLRRAFAGRDRRRTGRPSEHVSRGLPRGVYRTPKGRYRAASWWRGPIVHLGLYDTPAEAAAAVAADRPDAAS